MISGQTRRWRSCCDRTWCFRLQSRRAAYISSVGVITSCKPR